MQGPASAPQDEFGEEEKESIAGLAKTPKVVFSSKLEGPLPWENTELVSGDAATKVAEMKRNGTNMSTIGSLSLSRSLIEAGLVDRFRDHGQDGQRADLRRLPGRSVENDLQPDL